MRILHLHSSFHAGGKELRCVQLINAFGPEAQHTIVSAEPGALGAAAAIDSGIRVAYPDDFPSLTGKPLPRRLQKLAQAMRGHDLVLTYNWGAMDAVMAHTLLGGSLDLPPLVHHEDGFNSDEAVRLKRSRNWYRRLALERTTALVVPSRRLEAIARETWKQPARRVKRIANGVPVARYATRPRAGAVPGIVKQEGELWLGTLAGLKPVKNLPRLVRAFAALPAAWQLVILGEGPEREAIRSAATALGVADRVHLPGFVKDPASVIGLFDLFALSSDSEQFPLSVVEAMAAGLAVVSTDVGDVAAMVAEENRRFIHPPMDETVYAGALMALAADPGLRARIGGANREKAREEFDEARMIERYCSVYAAALGRSSFP